MHVVRHIFLARSHQSLDDWMAACLDVEHAAGIYHGTAVSALYGLYGETGEDVELRDDVAVGLDVTDALLHLGHQRGVDAALELVYVALSVQYFLLVLLKFLCDIAFRAHQGLLAHPFWRHLVLECIANLQVVAENVVVPYPQR